MSAEEQDGITVDKKESQDPEDVQDSSLPMLLISANVGSVFEDVSYGQTFADRLGRESSLTQIRGAGSQGNVL